MCCALCCFVVFFQVHNVSFSFELMQDAGLNKPKARPEGRLINPLRTTIKLHSDRPLYSNTVVGSLAVDGRAVTFGTARRGLGGLWPRPVPSLLYQM